MQFDEMNGFDDGCRAAYAQVERWLKEAAPDLLDLKWQEAEVLFRRIGITVAVYTQGGSPARLIPFDIIPRILAEDECNRMARGLEQRLRALNAFVWDCYHSSDIIRASADGATVHVERILHESQEGVENGDEQCAVQRAPLQHGGFCVELVVPLSSPRRHC